MIHKSADRYADIREHFDEQSITTSRFELFLIPFTSGMPLDYNAPARNINGWNEWAEGAYLEPDRDWHFVIQRRSSSDCRQPAITTLKRGNSRKKTQKGQKQSI